MNNDYFFSHNKRDYLVSWEVEERVLTLSFSLDGKVLETKTIPLLGTIDQKQLDAIVRDYWRSFVKKELKDIVS